MSWIVGVVTSRFNSEITYKLEAGAIEFLKSKNVKWHAVRVAGAVEIPLAAKVMFEQGFDAVVALGAVIRGETTHYDLVCNSVERGVSQLMLEYSRPIGFGVITTENDEQAEARAGGIHGNKGTEAAQVALEMLELIKNLQGLKKTSRVSGKSRLKQRSNKPKK